MLAFFTIAAVSGRSLVGFWHDRTTSPKSSAARQHVDPRLPSALFAASSCDLLLSSSSFVVVSSSHFVDEEISSRARTVLSSLPPYSWS
ncbi:hypothetical protein [Thauera sp. 2A1]|uniref:hypothetical protein n=1 Tax=Thauera sp. 2A1 TaxID=2570191 RepID=UPI001291857A|nr:hypothetical protein [Thauera sp. 2A1]KAI5914251.1 hypothetical protein GH664_13545 [Thauera sp. 2A1]